MSTQTIIPGAKDDTSQHDRDKDRLIHLICKAQIPALDAGQQVWTMCGQPMKTRIHKPVGQLGGLRCIVCETMRQQKTCIHCQRLTSGGN